MSDAPVMTRPRSSFSKSLALIGRIVLMGPPIGGVSVLFLQVAISIFNAHRLSDILILFSEVGWFVAFGYGFGVLPAFCFGVLFSISAFRFRWNSVSAAIVLSLPASLTSPFAIGLIKRGMQAELPASTAAVVFFIVLPAVVASVVCWYATRSLHRLQ